jgi:hypothetical protein
MIKQLRGMHQVNRSGCRRKRVCINLGTTVPFTCRKWCKCVDTGSPSPFSFLNLGWAETESSGHAATVPAPADDGR